MTITLTVTADSASELHTALANLAGALVPATQERPVVREADDTPRRGRGRPPKAESTIEPPVAPPEQAPTMDRATVQKKLIEVVQKVGKDACGALCRAHGGPNLSALDPGVYDALYADAVKLLEGQDPAA